jgi:hypothetical protein
VSPYGHIFPFDDTRALQLGNALHGNAVVTKICVPLAHLTASGNYDSLLSFIRNGKSLRKLVFYPAADTSKRVFERFLQASFSSKIETLHLLEGGSLPVELLSVVLRGTNSITSLIVGPELSSSTTGDVAHELKSALMENKTLTDLMIRWSNPSHIAAVLDVPERKSNIESFTSLHPLNAACCEQLAQSLPRFNFLKHLSIELDDSAASEKSHLMEGFRRNGSLHRIFVRESFFEREDYDRLRSYYLRNAGMAFAVEYPQNHTEEELLDVFVTAFESDAGLSWVYSLVRARVEDLVVAKKPAKPPVCNRRV